MKNSKKIFLLVHGAWEGAWSWEKTTEELEKSGHEVIAIDLPGHGDDKTPISDITLQVYADRVKAELDRIGQAAIVVAHSFGGYVVSQVAEEVPEKIEKLVFIASALPYDGKTAIQVFEEDEGSELLENLIFSDDQSSVTLSKDSIVNVIFGGATEEQLQHVFPKLVVQASKPFSEVVHTTQANFGSVAKAYIETTQDRVISLKAQRLAQNKAGIDEVITLESGHVPLETKPKELADALKRIALSGVAVGV